MRLQFLLKKQVFLKVQNPCRPGRIRRKALSGSLLGRIRATPRGWGALHTSVEKFHTRASTGRPGGVLLPLPPGLSPAAGRSPSTPASGPFSGSREESFHPCVRASFGRLNRTTGRSLLRTVGRSLSTPASAPLSGASTGQPYGAFYRTVGRAAGGSPAPRSDAVRRGLRRAGATTKPQR